jgi:hypothetical protein
VRLAQVRRGGIGATVALVALLAGVVIGSGPSASATHIGFLDLGHDNFVGGPTALFNTATSGDGTGLVVAASIDSDGNGVSGQTGSGIASGVYGENTSTGYGVAGRAINGTGVLADSFFGVALRAVSSSGTALRVEGVATFTRSGLAIAGAGQVSKGVTGVSVTASSLVLATVQGTGVDGMYIKSVQAIPAQSKLIIYFNQAVPAGKTLKIAWFVLN